MSTTTVENSIVVNFGFEIGLFTLASIFSSFFMLKRIKGNVYNLEYFFAWKKWPFLKNDKNFVRYTTLLLIIAVCLLVMPLVSLILWGIMVLVYENKYNLDTIVGGSIFLIGFSVIFFCLAVLYVKWSYFKIKIFSIIFMSLAACLYFAFQLYALLVETTPSFLGLSAVFLSINAIIMVLVATMSYSNNTGSIIDVLDKLQKNSGKEDAVDTRYNTLTVEEQYEKLLADPDYQVTEKEIIKYVTIANDKQEFNRSVLSGGLHTIFRKKSLLFKRLVLLTMYTISIGVLVAYAIIVDKKLPEKQLGYVTLVAVATTDVITFFVSQLNISHGQTTLTLLIVGMRCFLFGFGGTYWFLGYCSLYLLLGVVVGWKSVEHHFPLEIDYSKEKSHPKFLVRVIREPLFTYTIVNIVFIIVVAVVASVTSLDIPRAVFKVLGQDFETWVFGIACILISLTGICVMATFRLHQRRLKGIKDKFKFPLIKKESSTYLIFAYFTYLFAILCGVLWYVIVKDLFVLLTALIIPPVALAIYVLYLNFKKNEYRILADIKDLNSKTKNFLDAQAKAKQLKSQQTAKPGAVKDDLETVELKEEDKKIEDEVPEYLNFSSSAVKRKLVIHEDWRENANFFSAFFKRKLLASDYANILAILFILGALIAYSVVVYTCTDSYKLRAFTVSVTLLVATCTLLPMEGYFGTLQINWIQIALLVFGAAANYAYAAVVTTQQHNSVKNNGDAVFTAIYWFFFLPILMQLLIALYELKQKRWTRSLLSTILIGIVFAHLIGLGVLFICVDYTAAAVVTWCIVVFLLLAAGVYYIYVRNNRSWPRRLVVISCWSGGLMLSAVFIYGLCTDALNDFVGFSITYLAILLCLTVYAAKQTLADFAQKSTHPVFYSPWIFPIYKYDPLINGLKKYSSQGYLNLGIIFMLWIWSIAVVIWVNPASLGISIGCLCEVTACVFFVYMTTDSTSMLSQALLRGDLVDKSIKKAWLQARNSYLTSKHVTKCADIMTFREYESEADKLRRFVEDTKQRIRKEQGLQKVKPSTDIESLKKPEEQQELKELYAKLGDKLTAASQSFKDEVRLLIHFELLVILAVEQAITKEKMTLLAFINTKKSDLEANGLKFIFGPENLPIDAKYKLVMEKYFRLSEEQQKTFDNLKAAYLEQVKNEKVDASEKMKAEEEAKKQREKALSQKIEQKKKLMQDMNNVALKDMPDCVQKYERIVKEYGQANKKYEDPDFPPNQNSVGSNIANLVDKWDRPNGYNLFGNGLTPADPRQGSIGDCYLVSALSVAGKDNIEKALMVNEVKQKPEVGAYIVKFYFMGEPVEVIVDDLFPKDGQGEWAFCKSDGGNKLWPMLFEKAYAKLHGGYQKIVAGKVSYALSEITGGYPEEIKLTTAQKNIDSFWEKIMKYKANGYLLGAGTPENPQGDRAISDEGIIQGHAYAVLDLKEFEAEKLIKLRNPHGEGGAEWRGDWSDASIKWTEKAKKLLKPENKEDGVFWMSIQDFVYEFKSLYVCRIFDQKLWKKIPTLEGEWAGESAAGLPSKKNPNADLSKNPHFGIKVQRRCSVFIALTQVDRIDMFRGKLPIMFLVQKNGGKRVTSASMDLLAGTSGAPTDLITVSAEIILDVPTYPYTFSLMVATANAGEEGQGRFTIDIQSTDDLTIVDLK